MEDKENIIRQISVADISDGMHLSRAEGWNQTENDWRELVTNSSNPGLVVEVDGRVRSTITAVNYADKVTWIGMVLVDSDYRRQGYATSLLSAYFNIRQACQTFKLDATAAGREVYQRFGFREEYIMHRMVCDAAGVLFLPPAEVVRPVSIDDMDTITGIDSAVFGAHRHELMSYLLRDDKNTGWVTQSQGVINGFVLGRAGSRYRHIGPVTAANDQDASLLITAALTNNAGQPVVVDVMADKAALVGWLETIGFHHQRDFIRMCKGKSVTGDTSRQYCVCGPEFG